jgi:hypothetical protein
MKPDAPEGIRGLHKPMASNADGVQVNSLLPRTAKVMDKVLIRYVHHAMKTTTRQATTPLSRARASHG